MNQLIKFIVCLGIGGLSYQSTAQLLPLQYDTLERNQEFIMNGGVNYAGSAMQNQLVSKFLFGGFINSEIKDESFNRHRGINRFGGILNGDLEYRNYSIKPLKKRDWGILFKAGYHTFGGMAYSKDAFGLLFYGNEQYLGETANLSGLDFALTSFQKIGFGMIDRKTKSNVSINLYNISSRTTGYFRDFEVEQDSAGTMIGLTLDGAFGFAENPSMNQGVGLGIDLDFKIPFQWANDQTAYLQLKAENVGVGYLYQPQTYYLVDTTINYSGFQLSDFVGETTAFGDSLNLLDSLGVRQTSQTGAFILPGFIQAGKIVDEHNEKRVQSFFGIRLYPTLIYNPYGYAGAHFRVNDWFSCGANVSYGGFSTFRGGIYSSFKFDKLAFGLATENIVGLVSKKGNGKSIYFRLKCDL